MNSRIGSMTIFTLLISALSVAAPPNFSAVAHQRHRWQSVYDAAISAPPEAKRNALNKLISEALKQTNELKTIEIEKLNKPEYIVAPFSLLPILLEQAEQLAVSNNQSYEIAYHLAVARRSLATPWARNSPNERSTLLEYRAWARGLKQALSGVRKSIIGAQTSLLLKP